MARNLRLLAAALIVLDAGILVAFFIRRRDLLYPASQRRTLAAEAGLGRFEDLVLSITDGERLVAWWKPP
jgi:uncharacterized protein